MMTKRNDHRPLRMLSAFILIIYVSVIPVGMAEDAEALTPAAVCADAEETGRTVTLPVTADDWKDYLPWMGDPMITEILVSEGNEAFTSIDGVLFTGDGKELLLYPIGRTEETYTVPEGTERIDDECSFEYGCRLKTLILPASLRSFCEWNLFRTVIADYLVDPDNPVYCDVDGVLYSKDRKTLIAYPPGRTEESFTVPEGTETIGPSAFSQNEHIRRVFLPDSVQTIGDYAFDGSALESIRLPDRMKAIGEAAFFECYDLSDLRLPEGLTEIPEAMLSNTDIQGTLLIPEGVTMIGLEALCFLTHVTDIYWPDSLAILADGEWMETWYGELLGMVFSWNDWGIMDYTAVMHAHEGTGSAEWVRNYPHVISPQGTDTMDAEGYAAAVTAAMQNAGYPDAVLCSNPEVKWMAVKPLIAYDLHRAVAVFRQGEKTLLCGFDDLDDVWKLRWVNGTFLEDGNLPVMLAYYGEEELRIVLPQADDPESAVDYRFDADTLTLRSANCVEDYLWYGASVWYCVPEDGKLVYSAPEISWNETGRVREISGAEPFLTVPADAGRLSLRTMERVPEPREQDAASE